MSTNQEYPTLVEIASLAKRNGSIQSSGEIFSYDHRKKPTTIKTTTVTTEREREQEKDTSRQQHTDDDKILSFVHEEVHMESNVRTSARKSKRGQFSIR
jgi:hypothetical protein